MIHHFITSLTYKIFPHLSGIRNMGLSRHGVVVECNSRIGSCTVRFNKGGTQVRMRPIKILHTGDVHLGAKFSFLGPKGGEQRRQLLATFSGTVDLAITSQVDFFLITGDLFDSNFPPRSTLDEVALRTAAHGRRGHRGAAGAGHPRPPGPRLHLQRGPLGHPPPPPRVQARRAGASCAWTSGTWSSTGGATKAAPGGTPWHGLPEAPGAGEAWRIGLLHGSLLRPGVIDDDEVAFSSASLSACGLDYLALGHWHSFQDLSAGGTACAYSGSPEALYLGQDSGRVVLVTLGRGEPEIKSIQVGKRSFDRYEVDMSTVSDRNGLRGLIRQWADRDTYVEVVLKGVSLCDDLVNAQDLEEELAPNFYGIRIRDESFLASLNETRDMPEGIVSGEFVKIAEMEAAKLSGEERQAADEALRLGLAYLEGRAGR